MFKRKLKSLGFSDPDHFNIEDEKKLRSLVIWVEDQKIRHYTIDTRKPLRQIEDPGWPQVFLAYLAALSCPFPPSPPAPALDWLLSVAVQLEYADNADKYNTHTASRVLGERNAAPKVVSDNPLDNLDFASPDFKSGIASLAECLGVPPHPDPLVTLQALSHVVTTRLSQQALDNPPPKIEGNAVTLSSINLGFETGNNAIDNAGKVLRLLYIQDQRQLQTLINECIVETQKVTANPKTDSRLGRVGR